MSDQPSPSSAEASPPEIDRQSMDVDIACVGFGPAMGGFLSTLAPKLLAEDGAPAVESGVMPGMPPQVMCYERADDVSFGVSGVVTQARGIKSTFRDLKPGDIPTAAAVGEERVLYLLDPVGASRRPFLMKTADVFLRMLKGILGIKHHAFKLPWIPKFLRKDNGFVFSLGQFNQWVSGKVMETGLVQVWPSTPVEDVLIEGDKVEGVRLIDQGVDRKGTPSDAFLPGMDIKAALTVIADGPVGPIGQKIDDHFGMPDGHHKREWALGAKMVIELRDGVDLKPGTVLHTFGYPEPEIFGFFYVHPDNLVSAGVFIHSWFDSPVRNAYRYLQHWMLHPYIWQFLEGGTLRSWGAKSLDEGGRIGEPHLAGDGYARIGEGSGSTNVLTGSGVDEAWETGVQLAEGVLELLADKKEFTKENLDAAYVARRRASWVEKEGRQAEKARNGFTKGFVRGMMGMALAGFTGGRLSMPGRSVPPSKRVPSLEDYYKGRIKPEEIDRIRKECYAGGNSLHAALMESAGWPKIPYDGKLLVSQQDALLTGGKVQAPEGYADHVIFLHPAICQDCGNKICIEACSGEAIAPGGPGGVPAFDREKCVHCGACAWNCSEARPENPERANVDFRAGTGGLHSSEN